MLPTREYIYYGAVFGFIILGLATNVDLYWAAIGGIIGGTVGYIIWRIRRA